MNHTGLFSYILTRNVKNKKMRCIPIAAALCLAAMFIFAVMSLTGCADKRQTAADSGTEEFVTAISPTNIGRLAVFSPADGNMGTSRQQNGCVYAVRSLFFRS